MSDRYERLITARNFHYENFNKWLTFFYVAIGSVFLGYYSDGIKTVPHGQLLLNILGLIISLMLHWSAKGYYYWEINWIMLIHDHEKQFTPDDKVYGCFANKSANNDYFTITKGANISTSKISLVFSFIIASIWAYLLINEVLSKSLHMTALYYQPFFILLSFLLVICSGIIPMLFLKSNMNNLTDLKL